MIHGQTRRPTDTRISGPQESLVFLAGQASNGLAVVLHQQACGPCAYMNILFGFVKHVLSIASTWAGQHKAAPCGQTTCKPDSVPA